MRGKVTLALALAGALCLGAAAQKNAKPWTDWSKKDAEKILNESGWGQTQTETDTSEMFFTPTTRGGINDQSRGAEGATNQAVNVKYYIRFFSARPIRQALARTLMIDNKITAGDQVEGLKQFASLQSNQYIIVSLTVASSDQRYLGQVNQAFGTAETSTLKNFVYLERKNDGKRLFLAEYVKPGKDGFGARFIFPRTLDGQPFITPDAGEVRFVAEFPGNLVAASRQVAQSFLEINRRFKIADMMYEGALEY